jgi:predicted membrane protein
MDLSWTFVKANLVATPVALILMGLAMAAFGYFDDADIDDVYSALAPGLIHWIVAGVIAHELLHGIGFRYIGAVSWDQIRFGVKWKWLTPYAGTSSVLSARQYAWSIALPGVVLGVGPSLLAIALGSAAIAWFGAIMLAGAAGDALIVWTLRDVPPTARVQDSPDRMGCAVL